MPDLQSLNLSLFQFRKETITGCEATGTAGTTYMTRTHLLAHKSFKLCLHYFHRSDVAGDFHDHPWWFLTIVLWRGYNEHLLLSPTSGEAGGGDCPETIRRVCPGAILFRKAETTHWVELLDGKPAVTLCLMGSKQRTWGFRSLGGKWIPFHQYFKDKGC